MIYIQSLCIRNGLHMRDFLIGCGTSKLPVPVLRYGYPNLNCNPNFNHNPIPTADQVRDTFTLEDRGGYTIIFR